MTNFSLTTTVSDVGECNTTGFPNNCSFSDNQEWYWYSWNIFYTFIILICIFGMLGNGMVIYLLGVCVRRNPFTTYVLNLATADFGFLTADSLLHIHMFLSNWNSEVLYFLLPYACSIMFISSQSFLTLISLDRCVSVFFPLWHRCHRPTHLPATVCTLIWLFSVLPSGIEFIFIVSGKQLYFQIGDYLLIVNGFLCFPLMTISSLMLFSKICSKSKQQRKRKLSITILISVLLFYVFSIPVYIFFLKHLVGDDFARNPITSLCACINSSINPLIYYLVSRCTKRHSNENTKAMLQKLFREEAMCAESGISLS